MRCDDKSIPDRLRLGSPTTALGVAVTGIWREMAVILEQRNVDILYLQETKWKASKARNIAGGCKLFYNGAERRGNGIGIVMREKLFESVLEVNMLRNMSDKLMAMKLEVKGSIPRMAKLYLFGPLLPAL